ncbi:MAG TPA: C40 family peptidase [Jatrophihabitans sp.]|nr:C40 family peptidase [Jatrophihabitans sp.]
MPSSRPLLRRVLSRTRATALVTFLLVALGATAGGVAAQATPNFEPRIHRVNALLDRLSKQNDALDEQYNAAVAALDSQRKAAKTAQDEARAAAQAARRAHERFVEALTQQYEAGKVSSTGALLTSPSPQTYLDNLSTMSYLSDQFASTMKDAEQARARAHAAAAHASRELAAARVKAKQLQQRRAAIVARTQKYKQLLATLTEKQRRAYARARAIAAAKARAAAAARARAAAAQPTSSGSSVQQVVDYAIAQVGKPYVFGASGPDSFDCSGLTMAAWAQAGVALPHLASGQYNVGQHISYDQLQPGDLIFLYHPIEHVEIYVGPDLAVSAADPALGIVYVHPSQDMADYAGATRP